MIHLRLQVFEASGLKSQLHFPKRPAIEMVAGQGWSWELQDWTPNFVQFENVLISKSMMIFYA